MGKSAFLPAGPSHLGQVRSPASRKFDGRVRELDGTETVGWLLVVGPWSLVNNPLESNHWSADNLKQFYVEDVIPLRPLRKLVCVAVKAFSCARESAQGVLPASPRK